MTLARLKEEKRVYNKGLKPLVQQLKEDFGDLVNELTPELISDYVVELMNYNTDKDPTKFVFEFENRLYEAWALRWANIYCINNPSDTNTDKQEWFKKFLVEGDTFRNASIIDDEEKSTLSFKYNTKIPLSQFYIIEDEKEILKLKIKALEDKKVKLVEEIDKNIDTKQQAIDDMIKFNLNIFNEIKVNELKKAEELKQVLKVDVDTNQLRELIKDIS